MSPCRRVSLLLICSLLAGTVLPNGAAQERRCQCINLHSGKLNRKLLARLTVYPAGPQCANIEVIVTTTDGRDICLNPEKPWVKMVIRKILRKNTESYHL